MQPLQKFQKSLKLLRSLYKLIGQDVFTKEFRRGYIFYTICLLELCLILFLSIDLVGMDGLEESYRVIQACMLIGVIQILIKYYLLIDLHILRPIVISLEDIYRKNSQLTDEYYGICQRYARITELMFMITAGSYMGLVAFISIASALESSPKMQPVLYAYFPFVHEYSLLQLIVLDTFISLICSVNVFVMPAGDLSIYILAANLTMFPLIISMQMDELSTRLQLGRANVREIKRRWMHYILIHHEYVRWWAAIEKSILNAGLNIRVVSILRSLLRLLEGCVYKYCIIQFLTSSVFTILGVSAMSQVMWNSLLQCVSANKWNILSTNATCGMARDPGNDLLVIYCSSNGCIPIGSLLCIGNCGGTFGKLAFLAKGNDTGHPFFHFDRAIEFTTPSFWWNGMNCLLLSSESTINCCCMLSNRK